MSGQHCGRRIDVIRGGETHEQGQTNNVSGSRFTVVLDSGVRDPASTWSRIADQITEFANAAVVSRSGGCSAIDRGSSELHWQFPDEDSLFQSTSAGTRDLILVGAASGALYVRQLAVGHVDRIAGILLIDPFPVNFRILLDSEIRFAEDSTTSFLQPVFEEFERLEAITQVERALFVVPPEIPLTLITRGLRPLSRDHRAQRWHDAQVTELNNSTETRRIIAGGARASIPLERPDVIVEAIRDLCQRFHRPN